MLYRPNTVAVETEGRSEKKIRIFLAIMFFLQVFTTTLPFMRQVDPDTGLITAEISALRFVIQSEGIASGSGALALYGVILIVLPLTAFFFCIFDKRSKIKFLVSGICSVVCAIIVTFTVGTSIHYGAVFTLIINIVTLFMTSQGMMAVSARRAQSKR